MTVEELRVHLSKFEDIELLLESMGCYANYRIENLNNTDEDSLLAQWGVFDWGEGKFFELDITRQFAPEDEEDIRQLRSTLYFEVTEGLLAVGEDNFWCHKVKDIESFCGKFKQSEAFKICSNLKPVKWALELEYV